MPRSPRIEYPGARYHVVSRGNRREFILGAAAEKELFLRTLGETCERTGWRIHSYVLMGNHFHLLLETPEANLSEGMRWLQGTYGNRYNRRHRLTGHVWQGRFKSPVISDEGDKHFMAVSRYIHLNPARAGLLAKKHPRLKDYPWSSYPLICGAPSKRPAWLLAESVLGAYGLGEDNAANRRRYQWSMESTCRECLRGDLDEEEEAERGRLVRGWYIGERAFRDRLADYLEDSIRGRKKDSLSGGAKKTHGENQAEGIVAKSLRHWEISESDLKRLKPGDRRKQMLTALLRKRTIVKYEWLIEHLGMGSKSSVYKALREAERYRGRDKREWATLQRVTK